MGENRRDLWKLAPAGKLNFGLKIRAFWKINLTSPSHMAHATPKWECVMDFNGQDTYLLSPQKEIISGSKRAMNIWKTGKIISFWMWILDWFPHLLPFLYAGYALWDAWQRTWELIRVSFTSAFWWIFSMHKKTWWWDWLKRLEAAWLEIKVGPHWGGGNSCSSIPSIPNSFAITPSSFPPLVPTIGTFP